MGLSGSKKQTQTVDATTTSNQVQTPTLPAWAENALRNYTGLIQGAFDAGSPEMLQLPANQLQNGAASAAMGLLGGGQWQPTQMNQLPSAGYSPQNGWNTGGQPAQQSPQQSPYSYQAQSQGISPYNAQLPGTASLGQSPASYTPPQSSPPQGGPSPSSPYTPPQSGGRGNLAFDPSYVSQLSAPSQMGGPAAMTLPGQNPPQSPAQSSRPTAPLAMQGGPQQSAMSSYGGPAAMTLPGQTPAPAPSGGSNFTDTGGGFGFENGPQNGATQRQADRLAGAREGGNQQARLLERMGGTPQQAPQGNSGSSYQGGGVSSLGQWQQSQNTSYPAPADPYGTAMGMAYGAGMAQTQGYNPSGYTAPQLGSAERMKATSVGNVATSNRSNVGKTSTANAGNVGNTALARNTNLGRAASAEAAQLPGNVDNYMNPYREDVLNASMADFENNAAQLRAQQKAAAARNGALGGSRFGIAEAQLDGELSRARSNIYSGLLSNGFDNAMGYANADTGRRQEANLTNASAQNAFGLQQGAMNQQTSLANQDARNSMGVAQANLNQQNSQFNAGARNSMGVAQANLNQQNNQYNAGARNDSRLTQAGFRQQANMANQDAQNQFALQQAGLDQNSGQFNANAMNTAGQFNSQLQQQDFMRQLQAAGLLGDLGSAQGADNRANIGLANDIGNQRWQQDYMNNMAPFSYLGIYGDLLRNGQYPLFQGQTVSGTGTQNGTTTTTQSGGLLGDLLSAGTSLGSAALMASDRRLKENVEQIGTLENGLGLYLFNYVWDSAKRVVGVMADEVARIVPEALGPVVDGYATVDYSKIGSA